MCGIVGIINKEKEDVVSKNLLKSMTSVLKHRGPDEEGFWIQENVGLGHQRLKIIDLETGQQPIHNEDKTIWIICNGEIYNYKNLRIELEKKNHVFYTKSDTEVIIHLYEDYQEDCVCFLHGMFAFVIWDKIAQKMVLIRDRMGIKPLYYYNEENFVFASEIKSILKVPFVKRDIDFGSLKEYFTYLYILGPNTIFKRIKKLLPGELLIYKNGIIFKKKYWDFTYKDEILLKEKEYKEREYVERFYFLLKNSVKMHLVSDVPIGVFLSGGIDSSTLVALMSDLKVKNIKTFSIGYNKKEGYYDERNFARQVAKKFNTEHYEFEVKPILLEILPQLIYHFDEPFADASAIPTYYVSKMAKEYVKVILTGTGSDDILGGYRRYLTNKLMNIYHYIPFLGKKIISSFAYFLPGSRRNFMEEYVILLKKFLQTSNLNSYDLQKRLVSIFQAKQFYKLFPFEIKKLVDREFYDKLNNYYKLCKVSDFINRSLYVDLHSYLPDDLLVKEDRMTMANSIEGRVPFLDHQLVEFTTKLPSAMKIRGFETKYILKKAVKNLLPKNIIYRRKHGFAVPVSEWLRKEIKNLFYQTVFSTKAYNRGYLNLKYVEELFLLHQKKKQNFGEHLWAILIFELWCQEFLDK